MHSFPRSWHCHAFLSRCWHRHAFVAYILYAAKPTFQMYPALSSITFLHMRCRHAFLSYVAGTILQSLPTWWVLSCIPLQHIRCNHAFLSSVSGTLSCIPLSVSESLTAWHGLPLIRWGGGGGGRGGGGGGGANQFLFGLTRAPSFLAPVRAFNPA